MTNHVKRPHFIASLLVLFINTTKHYRYTRPYRASLKNHRLGKLLLLCCLGLASGNSYAMAGYLTDILDSFSDTSRNDTCGNCHNDWSGSGARNDFGLAYKLWDFDIAKPAGMSPDLLNKDLYGTDTTIQNIVDNPLSDAPFAFVGSADKDGDGYINLFQPSDRSGMPGNIRGIYPAGGTGGVGGLATPPAGWDIDDNDANQGNVPWGINDALLYYSADNIAPNAVADLTVSNLASQQLTLSWTAPADDEPASAGPDANKAVHHYDIRYTSQTLIDNFNVRYSGQAAKLCSNTPGMAGNLPCDIRNPDHWQTLWQIGDCGIRNGSGADYMTANGRVLGAEANGCLSGVAGWNRGEATPLMRALYEGAPKLPGSAENYVLQEVTTLGTPTIDFAGTDPHNGMTNTYPNYIADDQLYWLALRADDAVLQPQIDAVFGGLFYDAVSNGIGLHSLRTAGLSGISNIIAVTAGPNGAAITAYSPQQVDPTNVVTVTIDGLGLNDINAAGVSLVDNNSGVSLAASAIDYSGAPTQIVATFDLAGTTYTPGVYDLETRTATDAITTVWIDAITLAGDTGNSAGTLQFNAPLYSVNEDGGIDATINVTRTGGSSGTLSVDIVTIDGTAIAGLDYIATSSTLFWLDGDSTIKSLTIPIINDAVDELDETVNLALSNSTLDGVADSSVLGAQNTATLTIIDSVGTVQFSAASYSVTEDGLTASITVTRSGGSNGVIAVDYASSDGTAVTTEADNTNGLRDYEPVIGTLTWVDGDSISRTISIAINEDSLLEYSESFNLSLTNPTGGALGSTSTTTITIQDNEAIVSLLGNQFENLESGSFLIFDLRFTGTPSSAVSIDYSTTNGTATAGQDYVATSGTITWDDTMSRIAYISVPIIDDTIVEADENFTLTLSNPSNITLQQPSTATGTIVNDDCNGSLLIYPSLQYVDEGDAVAVVSVSRGFCSSGVISVDYATSDGSIDPATAGDDYISSSGTLTWADGDITEKSFTININDDALQEAVESISVSLSNPTGGATLPIDNSATIRIIDNESPPPYGKLTFTVSNYQITEGDLPFIDVIVSRIDGSIGNISVEVVNEISHPLNTATIYDDYYYPSSLSTYSSGLNWPDGDTSDRFVRIRVYDDAIVEDIENILLRLNNPQGGSELGTITDTIISITDNDIIDPTAGTLAFSSPSYSVTENGTTAFVVVTRSGNSTGTVAVDYVTNDGTAETTDTTNVIGRRDYEPVSGTLSWLDGDNTSKVISIPINDDIIIESRDEFFSITLYNPVGGAVLGATSTAAIIILDDDTLSSPGVMQFSSPTYSVAEDGASGMATITVTRSGGSSGTVSIDYATTDWTATAGVDYTASMGTLTWLDGDSSPKVFSIPVINDAVAEDPDETVNLTLFNPVLNGVADATIMGTQSTAVLTIIDSLGYIEFSSSNYTVDENGIGSVTVTVNRIGGSNGLASADYATSDGTATTGVDYSPVSGTLAWLDGDTLSKIFTIPIIDDLDVEADETIYLYLSNVVGAGMGAPTSAIVTIIDDETPIYTGGTIEFSSPVYSIEETGINAIITVTRSGGSNGVATIDYQTSDGTALAGIDYITTSGTLTWADGVTGAQTIVVPINDDTLIEADETFTVSLSNPAGATLGLTSSTSIVIISNDASGTIQLDASNYSVIENGGINVTISITRIGGNTGAVSVNYETVAGTAIDGSDYIGSSGTLTWADGDNSSKAVTVNILDDTIEEADENFTFRLLNPINTTLSSPAFTTVTIINDDSPATEPGIIEFSSPTYSVAEEGGIDATITVTRTGGSSGSLSIDYASSDGTATAGVDYTMVSGTLSWLDGDSSAKTFSVPVINDAIDEIPNETVNLSLSNPTLNGALDLAVLGTQSSATLSIIDSAGTIQFSSPTYSANEDGGITATITVSRVGGSNGAASVNYSTSDGSATAGSDYIATSGTLSWLNYESGSKAFTVPVINDAIDENPDETVLLNLSAFTGANPGTLSTATLTIVDSSGSVQFNATAITVTEDGMAATFTATRAGGSNGALSVDYATSNGTALAGVDYLAASGTLSWADGDSTAKTISVAILDDTLIETNETFNLSLSNAVGASLGVPSAMLATIIDDDDHGTLQFSVTTSEVNEADGLATISVERIGGASGVVSIDYASQAGTARAGRDYLDTNGTLSWADGDSSAKTFTVSINEDTRVEDSESIILSLSNATGGATVGANATATLTIVDNDVKGGGKK